MRPGLILALLFTALRAGAEPQLLGTHALNDGPGITRPYGIAEDAARDELWLGGGGGRLIILGLASICIVASILKAPRDTTSSPSYKPSTTTYFSPILGPSVIIRPS